MAGTTFLEDIMRNALANAFDTACGSTASLRFENSADTVLATCPMANPAFGTATAGVITRTADITDETSATLGTCHHVSLYDAVTAGNKLAEFDISTDASCVFQISALQFGNGDTIGVSNFTVTVPDGS